MALFSWMKRVRSFVALACAAVSVLAPVNLRAATTNIIPVADTALMEYWTNNNIGGMKFFPAGTTEKWTRNRGLLQFDLAGSLPPGSKINSANLYLNVTGQPGNGYDVGIFGIHRVLKPWGEGNKVSPTNCMSCLGAGELATFGEASWEHRLAETTNTWTTLGGAPGVDYVSTESSSQVVYDIFSSPYVFYSSAETVADVQLWLDNPATNFGWMLICQPEDVQFTARRFASREDPDFPPVLEIDYTPPLRIDHAEHNGNQFKLHFLAEAGQPYTVQFRNAPASTNAWSTLTNIPSQPAPTSLVVTDIIASPQRVYRLLAP